MYRSALYILTKVDRGYISMCILLVSITFLFLPLHNEFYLVCVRFEYLIILLIFQDRTSIKQTSSLWQKMLFSFHSRN